jgi:mono/diheme cytochrome c family protein
VADDEPAEIKEGAEIFAERCSGCHTLSAAGTQGSANRSQRTQGPDFDQRTETVEDVIFAIRNGGFSGAIMPQNIVVGDDADKVASFLAKYAGQDVQEQPRPASSSP